MPHRESQPVDPAVDTCARVECSARFRRLGEGKLFVLPVKDPAAWGLPEHLRQKVLWLCDGCSHEYTVRFDREHYSAAIVPLRRRAA